MPQVNWNEVEEQDFSLPEPGVYLMTVESCEEKQGGNGPYFNTLLRGVENKKVSCFDIMSFAPKALPITKRKFSALGVNLENEGIETDDLLGLTAWVALKLDTYTNSKGEERQRLVVDISARGFDAGYKAEDQAGKVEVEQPAAKPAKPNGSLQEMENDIPF